MAEAPIRTEEEVATPVSGRRRRRRRRSRRHEGDPCGMCGGTRVQVDDDGRCPLGHQVLSRSAMARRIEDMRGREPQERRTRGRERQVRRESVTERTGASAAVIDLDARRDTTAIATAPAFSTVSPALARLLEQEEGTDGVDITAAAPSRGDDAALDDTAPIPVIRLDSPPRTASTPSRLPLDDEPMPPLPEEAPPVVAAATPEPAVHAAAAGRAGLLAQPATTGPDGRPQPGIGDLRPSAPSVLDWRPATSAASGSTVTATDVPHDEAAAPDVEALEEVDATRPRSRLTSLAALLLVAAVLAAAWYLAFRL